MAQESRVIDRWWPGRPQTRKELFELAWPALVNDLRMTVAAVAAFMLTSWYTQTTDLTGALSALLVTQATTSSSLKYGLARSGAVLLGVTIAVLIATQVGLNVGSLFFAVFAGLILASLLRFGDSAAEVAISAMLILQAASTVLVGQEMMPAMARVVSTVLGTGVGVAFMVLLPPRIPTRMAAAQVRAAATAAQRPVNLAAEAMRKGPITKSAARSWLATSHTVTDQVSRASKTITRVSDTRKLNSRAIGVADVVPILRSGLDTLERCLLAERALFLVMEREAPAEGSEDGYGPELRGELADALSQLGSALASFGVLVAAEASGRVGETEDTFRTELTALREQRDHLAEVLVVDPSDVQRWLLRGSLLSAFDQVLEHLDLQDRTRLREHWELTQAGLRLPAGQVGPTMSASSRKWFQRRHSVVSQEPSTAQADFLSDTQRTQPLPVNAYDVVAPTVRRDQVVALGELAAADRTGSLTPKGENSVSEDDQT